MNYLKLTLFCVFALLFNFQARAQSCTCLKVDLISTEAKGNTMDITVRVKNSCNRRMWFYTRGFWVRLSEQQVGAETSVLHKLNNSSLPEFLMFKWMEEKKLTFKTDMSQPGKVAVSYANTDHEYPARLFGYATYMCETDLNKKAE